MWKMTESFNASMVNFKDGHHDRDLKAAKNLKSRIQSLKSACSKCNADDSVKNFFLRQNVKKVLDYLQTELTKDKPNPGVIWKNIGIIGKQSCKPSHLTHRSYAVWENHDH